MNYLAENSFKRIWIAPEIFSNFPDYSRGVVVATGVDNRSTPDELLQQLRAEEDRIRTVYNGIDLNQVTKLENWRNAFRSVGIKPTKYRASIDAMIRRIVQGFNLPSINCLVDIGNLFSLRHLVPVGCHAIDVLEKDMALRLANGDETFQPFGSPEIENPEKGEIIFVDGNQVMTRRWVWRQAEHTLVQSSTRALEFNVDGLYPVTRKDVENICEEISETISHYCGGKIHFDILVQTNPEMPLIYS